jgi:hypothetical protein
MTVSRRARVAGIHGFFVAAMIAVVAGPVAHAQTQLFAYPKGDQSPEQQATDKAECHQWSVQQTGFDPAQPVAQAQQAQVQAPPACSTSRGGAVRGAARGAAVGSVGGAVAGDAGTGAAAGAAMGALGGTMRRRQQARECQAWEQQKNQQLQQQSQQAAQQHSAQQQDFDRAWSACMSARNYQIQ